MKRLVALALLVVASCASTAEETRDSMRHEASVLGSPTGPGPHGALCGAWSEPCECQLISPVDLGARAPFHVDSTRDLDLLVDAKATDLDRVPIVMPGDGTIVDISDAQDVTGKLDSFVAGPRTHVTAIQLDCHALVVLSAVTLRRAVVEGVAAHPTAGLHLLKGSLIGYLPRTRDRSAPGALTVRVEVAPRGAEAHASATRLAWTR